MDANSDELEIMTAIDLARLEELRPRASAPKNRWADDEYWKGAQLSAESFHLRQEQVELSRLVDRLGEVSRRVADLEYKLEVHMNTLDELAHRM